MANHESGNTGGEEPVNPATKRAIYDTFEKVLNRFGYEDEAFVTASIALDEVHLTAAPEDSMPIIKISKPYRGPSPTHNFEYEVIYGFGPSHTEAALHIAFLGDNTPVVQGIRKGPLDTLDGASPEIEVGWPTWGLCEIDARRLLEDLQHIAESPGIGGDNGADS
jgi:hypothetical protein